MSLEPRFGPFDLDHNLVENQLVRLSVSSLVEKSRFYSGTGHECNGQLYESRAAGIPRLSLCSHLDITRVISRTKSGFVYVNATSPDQ